MHQFTPLHLHIKLDCKISGGMEWENLTCRGTESPYSAVVTPCSVTTAYKCILCEHCLVSREQSWPGLMGGANHPTVHWALPSYTCESHHVIPMVYTAKCKPMFRSVCDRRCAGTTKDVCTRAEACAELYSTHFKVYFNHCLSLSDI